MVDGAAERALLRCLELGLPVVGVHCHVGSQLLDTECHEGSVGIMVDLLIQVKRELGLEWRLDDTVLQKAFVILAPKPEDNSAINKEGM